MKIRLLVALLIISIFGVTVYLYTNTKAQTTTAVIKEIGDLNPIGNNFSPQTSVQKDTPSWIRLTVNGKTDTEIGGTGYSGADIMMVLDATQTMGGTIPANSDGSGGSVKKSAAAISAMKAFVDGSDNDNDWIGFGSYVICIQYNSNHTPVLWDFQNYSTKFSKTVAYSTLHRNLSSIKDQKTSIKNMLDTMTFFYYNSGNPYEPTYCSHPYGGDPGQTSIAAGITLGNTQLTPILNDSNASSYRSSTGLGVNGYNNGPLTRGGNVKKYMLLLTDGEESAHPHMTDPDIDNEGRTPLENAAYYGVQIDTFEFGTNSSTNTQRLKDIASQTGGTYYKGGSVQSILSNINTERTQITQEQTITKLPVSINEQVNGTYFKIDPLSYSSTFKITRSPYSGESGEQDITNSICPSLNCVSNQQYTNGNLTGFTVNLDSFGSDEKRYVYFRVTPIKSSTTAVDVDSSTSSVTYKGSADQTYTIPNTQVTIGDNQPFFQTAGDIYSGNTINSQLPKSTNFSLNTNSILFSSSTQSYGVGTSSTNGWIATPYALSNNDYSYSAYYNKYKSHIQSIPITGMNSLSAAGYYTNSNSTDLTLNGSNWDNKVFSLGNTIVIFVPGDLYIGSNFTVTADGKSSLAFIVNGRIGIDPSVTKVEGIYLADGVIDTSCKTSSQFQSDNTCSPNSGSSSGGSQLALNGIFVSNSGFNLDRYGTPGSQAGEVFNYRPDFLMSTVPSLGTQTYTWKESTSL